MRKQYQRVMSAAVVALSLIAVGRVTAEDQTIITLFQNGYLSWTNVNSNLYYTVEYRPNLSETNPAWDGSYRVSQDVKSTNTIISVPVGCFYRVVGCTEPLHTSKLSSTTTVVNAGYYVATNLTQVDADLEAGNIKTNVTLFGVVGTLSTNAGGSTYAAAVPKTGQTNSYATRDDGALKQGVALPTLRFTVGTGVDGTNCVTDNLTGLIWARNANMFGDVDWGTAVTNCNNLTYGGFSDWRLPNAKELYSLIDLGQSSPPLPSGHPFTGVFGGYYWSSSTMADYTDGAWFVRLSNGGVNFIDKTDTLFVWPVRGGLCFSINPEP